MPFPDLPPERVPGSPGHMPDHELIEQALEYVEQAGYRDDPNFPPLPDQPVLGQDGHVVAHQRIRAILEYIKDHPSLGGPAAISNTPTGTYAGDDGHNYTYYEFTSSGTLTVTAAGFADLLIIGGGGSGGLGTKYLGGGGAGGMLELSQAFLPAGALSVVVGAGGQGQYTPKNYLGTVGANGESSLCGPYVAVGGGAGGGNQYYYDGNSADGHGLVGGSGGGNGGKGTPGQGHDGGTSDVSNGGGAGGSDGSGRVSSITGAPVTYAQGGVPVSSTNQPANTGNGGGGASTSAGSRSGAGGSGIVVVRIITN